MSIYVPTSPYFATPRVNQIYLDFMTDRPIPRQVDDILFKINTTYNLRPDLLAYDLYGDSRLWWVFASRNPNRLKDPYFDFVSGLGIYLPKLDTLRGILGI